MGSTPVDNRNYGFSKMVHVNHAKLLIYPKIWPGLKLDITHQDGNKADKEDKVDVIVKAHRPGMRAPMTFTVQERWRRSTFSSFRDITITEFNNNSGKPAEFYDGKMQFMLYGYFDESCQKFGEVVLVNIGRLFTCYLRGAIKENSTNGNNKNQDFVCFHFTDLEKIDAIDWAGNSTLSYGSQTDFLKISTSAGDYNHVADYWRRNYMTKYSKIA